MESEQEVPEYTEEQRRLFAALPRELDGDPDTETRLIAELSREGFFGRGAALRGSGSRPRPRRRCCSSVGWRARASRRAARSRR